MQKQEFFPDGTPIDGWFYDLSLPKSAVNGKRFVLTDYGIFSDGKIYTKEIQTLIDKIAECGGGVLTVPQGTFYSGALFFKQGVHLCVEAGGILKGSDDISDYPVCQTRIEGQNCLYFPALINADSVDGFTVFGEGTIDGNGLRAWKGFWARQKWNKACTNKDEQRARLIFISNSKNVTLHGLRLQNSQFWTNHIYKCHHVRFLHLDIFSPKTPVPAPSTDGIDIDACTDVLVKNCRMEVNDDAIALKGGKGVDADKDEANGANERILVEDCEYGFCCGALTCGSESIYNRNILVRRLRVKGVNILLWLKMRSDTPQKYEYITMEDVKGTLGYYFIDVNPWRQFHNDEGKQPPKSVCQKITVKNCECKCLKYFNVQKDKQYILSDFSFEKLKITAEENGYEDGIVERMQIKDVTVVKI